ISREGKRDLRANRSLRPGRDRGEDGDTGARADGSLHAERRVACPDFSRFGEGCRANTSGLAPEASDVRALLEPTDQALPARFVRPHVAAQSTLPVAQFELERKNGPPGARELR